MFQRRDRPDDSIMPRMDAPLSTRTSFLTLLLVVVPLTVGGATIMVSLSLSQNIALIVLAVLFFTFFSWDCFLFSQINSKLSSFLLKFTVHSNHHPLFFVVDTFSRNRNSKQGFSLSIGNFSLSIYRLELFSLSIGNEVFILFTWKFELDAEMLRPF